MEAVKAPVFDRKDGQHEKTIGTNYSQYDDFKESHGGISHGYGFL